jgi:DNA-binding NarL/FixJ family response regulator
VRIVIADESGMMRDGLCALLGSTPEFEIVGTGASTAEALQSASGTRPDLIVADLARIEPAGERAIARFKTHLPDVRVLVLTSRQDDGFVDEALRAGADGYLLKHESCNELFAALRSVAAGKQFVSAALGGRREAGVAAHHAPAQESSTSPAIELTDREREVIRLIAAGHRTREMAKMLSLSPKTIEKHRTSLMRKLGLRNASAVAAYAIAHGIA